MQIPIKTNKGYNNFRWFFTQGGSLVIGGKSDKQNEIVLKEFLKPEYIVMHTSSPGSPFCIIQKENPTDNDLEECAIFCACFSKQWKSKEKIISIDIFKGKQVYKIKGMKTGTFGVKGEKKTMKVKPELVIIIQKGRVRAVPRSDKDERLAEIKHGDLTKEEAADRISKIIKDKYHLPVSKEEIMAAIPSGNLEVK